MNSIGFRFAPSLRSQLANDMQVKPKPSFGNGPVDPNNMTPEEMHQQTTGLQAKIQAFQRFAADNKHLLDTNEGITLMGRVREVGEQLTGEQAKIEGQIVKRQIWEKLL